VRGDPLLITGACAAGPGMLGGRATLSRDRTRACDTTRQVMGLFRKRQQPQLGPVDILVGSANLAVEDDLPYARSYKNLVGTMFSPTSAAPDFGLATRSAENHELPAIKVVWEAIRLAVERRDQQLLEEVLNLGTMFLVRWNRHLMSRGMMPEEHRWG
jgi:hypothetical protein